MLNYLKTSFPGIVGLASSATVPAVFERADFDYAGLMEVVTQIVIAVSTLIALFKKNKNGKNLNS